MRLLVSPSNGGRDAGVQIRRNLLTTTDRTKSSASSSAGSSSPTDYHSRYRRRAVRRGLAAIMLTVVLLVAQASVAGGLAADSDRKSRRKQSPPIVDSTSYVAEADHGDDDGVPESRRLASVSSSRYAVGTGRKVYGGGDSAPWRNSSVPLQPSPHVVNTATMATTSSATNPMKSSNEDSPFVNPKPADLTIECKQLRSKRYISDGFCTSVKPVVDVVCTGSCLPIRQLPWYAEFIKVWSHAKTLQYRCVDDDVRRRDVLFACDNGETRSYKIRVVRSCKCKRYVHNQNESPASSSRKKKNRKSRRSAASRMRSAAYDIDDDEGEDSDMPTFRSRWNDDDSRRDGDGN